MMTSGEVRQHFLNFFKSKGHTIVPSAPVVIKDDPSLLFTNAGMNQFKDYFLGNKKPPHTRVADTQKCLRVSGKHNDLEEVGVDTYHHTMFEMLGNWSFGNAAGSPLPYFKEEAIAWSWELLTEIYAIEKDRLYVTVFEGDAKENLPKDDEAIGFWKKWIAEDRIIMGNKKDNFWEMGETGPCGPCTEIHVDTRTDVERKKVDGRTLVNNDDPEVIEIWNNVFIQYNRKKDGSLDLLPAKHVDTGMGFERLVRVLQKKHSNYDTDVFTGTIAEVEILSGKKYSGSASKQDIAFRVIADHIRAIAFPIADALLPSNTGAGYVIRRILRRAVRYYYSYLDVKEPLLYKLIPHVAGQFKNVFPELAKQMDFVSRAIKEEEESFLRTLHSGITYFDSFIKTGEKTLAEGSAGFINYNGKRYVHDSSKTIPGEFAFDLNDTYGFPVDLTQLMAKESGWAVDMKGFETSLQQQKDRSRMAGIIDTQDWISVHENGSSKFVGYNTLEAGSRVLKYRKSTSKGEDAYQIVLDITPFYAESGGQVGDTGQLVFGSQLITVTDTKKENDLIIHLTQTLPEDIYTGVVAKVDGQKRIRTQVHHTATHLMHAALRLVLGKHVVQKGSLVNEGYLRFDFSHFAKMTDQELMEVESMANERIRENIPVVIKEMPKEEAIALGAMALFGEKYGDVVRVVIIDPAYSIELCGGTHVANTGELGIFKIKHETAVGAGVRRIEAVSGKAAENFIHEQFGLIREIRDSLKNPKDIVKAIENLSIENSALKKIADKFEAINAITIKNELLNKIQVIDGTNFIGEIVGVSQPDALKKICFSLKNELKNYAIVLAADIDGKPHVAVMLDESISAAKTLRPRRAPCVISMFHKSCEPIYED